MEVVTGNEPPTRIRPGQSHEIGRAHGLDSSDQTISRRHLSLSVAGATNGEEIRLQFEVLGRNPIYVHTDNEVKIFRRSERGEMLNGDMFCVSAKNPVWYSVRRIEDGADAVRRNDSESELAGNLESDFGFKGVEDLDQMGVDISGLDPVKEFDFVVEGHEFDTYPKKMIRDIKNWDWFLEEEGKNSEEDEGKKVKASGRRKRKKGTENDDDDEEWSGESEDERVLMDKSRKARRAKYTTRSKDHGKPSEESSTRMRNRDDDDDDDDEDEEDEDEDDETLGGFVVNDENLEEEEEGGELEEDDEEELEDEYDEDEDEDE